jgi:carboxylesterase type B
MPSPRVHADSSFSLTLAISLAFFVRLPSNSYRLGALGFSAAPPPPGKPPIAPHIPVQAPVDLDLNVGFKDQLEALKWINREIENWGGDPKKVSGVGQL